MTAVLTRESEALALIVEDVLSGQVVHTPRADYGIREALWLMGEDERDDWLEKLAVTHHAAVILDTQAEFRDRLERLMREKLPGTSLVQDVARRLSEREDD